MSPVAVVNELREPHRIARRFIMHRDVNCRGMTWQNAGQETCIWLLVVRELAGLRIHLVDAGLSGGGNILRRTFPEGLDRPILEKYDQSLFNKFPEYHYSPIGPATNYQR